MLVFLFLAAIFAASGAYSDIFPEKHEFVEMVNQVLKEKGLNSDLIHEIQELKGQHHNHNIRIEHMETEIGDLKLTVENQRSQNQELLDLKMKNQQQITGLEMELSHLKAVLLDPAEIRDDINSEHPKEPTDTNDEMSAAESSVKINSGNSKALKEPKGIIENTGNKQHDSRNMNNASQIINSQYEGPTKQLDQNPLIASRKVKWNEKQRKNEGKIVKKPEKSQLHKGSKYLHQNDIAVNHDKLTIQHDRPKRHANTSHIAFSAYLGHSILHAAAGHTIRCDQVILNEGNGYNSRTGIFTARVTGVYLFTFNIAIYDKERWTWVKLVVDSRNIVDAVAGAVHVYSAHTMSGNTAIVQVNENESVWLEAYTGGDGELISDSNNQLTTFSGVLLYAN